jgi:hypothetical protein
LKIPKATGFKSRIFTVASGFSYHPQLRPGKVSYSLMDLEPPRYSTSIPAPEYSVEPICGERTLQQTPRSSQPVAESTYIRHSRKTTVVLHNQEENAKMPSYGRGASITGSVLFESDDSVSKVVVEVRASHIYRHIMKILKLISVQIYGQVETMSTEEGARTVVVINDKRVLWSDVVQNGHCPSQVEFFVRLPQTFDDKGEKWQLPPTYAVGFHGVPGLFVRTSYYMQFLIMRRPTRKIGFLTKTHR